MVIIDTEGKYFVRYTNEIKSNGIIIMNVIQGLEYPDKKGYVHKKIDINTFSDKATKVPTNYVKKRYKRESSWFKTYVCNPNYKLIEKNNEEYKKIKNKYEGKKVDRYFTHDNGGRPYLVYVNKTNKTISVYRVKPYTFTKPVKGIGTMAVAWMYIDCVGTWKYRDIFIGHSPKNKMTEFSGGYGRKFYGNSILIEISHLEYVWIGNYIHEFKSKSTIKKFVSPVGNNDVPYPYATDQNGDHYLMICDRIVKGLTKKGIDPYDVLYGNVKCNECMIDKMSSRILVRGEY
jgi:hypothetical protein